MSRSPNRSVTPIPRRRRSARSPRIGMLFLRMDAQPLEVGGEASQRLLRRLVPSIPHTLEERHVLGEQPPELRSRPAAPPQLALVFAVGFETRQDQVFAG